MLSQGRLARPVEDYDVLTIMALLTQHKLMSTIIGAEKPEIEPHWTEPVEVVVTGDPVIDEIERQIARGEEPDLDKL